jgi:uncharacterized protein YjiS (DUF1127 family)
MSPQNTLSGRAAEAAGLPEIRKPVSACLSTVGAWILRCAERRALCELAEDGRQLRDAGLSREQVLREAAKPFWRR